MNGRDKCELLNQIRQKIADENNIEFKIYECTFEGDCTGTCPKCESELKYLENELKKKQESGEKINIENIFTLDETDNGDDGQAELVPEDYPEDDETLCGEPVMEGIIDYEEDRLMGDVIPPEDLNENY